MSRTGAPLSIALTGFGTVGRSVARILCEQRYPALRLAAICSRRIDAVRAAAEWVPPDVVWTDDVETAIASGADVFVELIGGIEPARSWIEGALRAGRSVVTANKQVIAEHGPALIELARRCRRSLCYEAAVGGSIPVVRGVQEGLAGDRLTRIEGIVNGTCNFVLTEMAARRVSMQQAVTDAQARGFAEQDPSADLDGIDARAKLAILAAIGFGEYLRPGDIPVESIRAVDEDDLALADELGCVVRQISWACRSDEHGSRIAAGVLPALIDARSWLARADGAENAVVVSGERSGQTVCAGQGAGGDATAVAVVSDLLAIAHGQTVPRSWPTTAPVLIDRDFNARHYVRVDQPVSSRPQGSTGESNPADPATALRLAGITPERVWQRGAPGHPRWAALVSPCSHVRLNLALDALQPARGAGRMVLGLPIFGVDRLAATPR